MSGSPSDLMKEGKERQEREITKEREREKERKRERQGGREIQQRDVCSLCKPTES